MKLTEEKKQRLIDRVIEQIKKDIADGDVEALDELLKFSPNKNLMAFLSDDEQKAYYNTENEILEFKKNWGQSHSEICANLGYDNDCSEILIDDYFWIEEDQMWYNKSASMFTEREKEIADMLRQYS